MANVDTLSLACSRLRDSRAAELRKREHEIKTCLLLSRFSPLSGIGIRDNGHNGHFRPDDGLFDLPSGRGRAPRGEQCIF